MTGRLLRAQAGRAIWSGVALRQRAHGSGAVRRRDGGPGDRGSHHLCPTAPIRRGGYAQCVRRGGFAAAIRFRQGLDEGWRTHEGALLARAEAQLSALPGVRILGSGPREGCLSFAIQGVQPFDAAALLDQLGIAVRAQGTTAPSCY